MKKWLRRIRGALGTAVTWAFAWIPFGALWGVGDWLLSADATPLSYLVVASAALFGGAGFAGGAIFSMVLARIEGSRRFDQLSIPRFVGWGAVGGLLLSSLLLLGPHSSPDLGLSPSLLPVLGCQVERLNELVQAIANLTLFAIGQAALIDVEAAVARCVDRHAAGKLTMMTILPGP